MSGITQRDRDAAYPFRGMVMAIDCGRERWDAGEFDDTPLIQAFAAHRATPSQGLDAATVERCAQMCDKLAAGCRAELKDSANDARTVSVLDGYTGACETLAANIRALATDPHQHGGKGA